MQRASQRTQVLLYLVPVSNTDHELERLAELALTALAMEGDGLALGVVASVDLDRRLVELEVTLEASSASKVRQKQALILGALERAVSRGPRCSFISWPYRRRRLRRLAALVRDAPHLRRLVS